MMPSLTNPAHDPIPAKESTSGWKVMAGIGGFALAVGIGLLTGWGGVGASRSGPLGPSGHPGIS